MQKIGQPVFRERVKPHLTSISNLCAGTRQTENHTTRNCTSRETHPALRRIEILEPFWTKKVGLSFLHQGALAS